jgi:methylase of polypeptide subunit release factors
VVVEAHPYVCSVELVLNKSDVGEEPLDALFVKDDPGITQVSRIQQNSNRLKVRGGFKLGFTLCVKFKLLDI